MAGFAPEKWGRAAPWNDLGSLGLSAKGAPSPFGRADLASLGRRSTGSLHFLGHLQHLEEQLARPDGTGVLGSLEVPLKAPTIGFKVLDA